MALAIFALSALAVMQTAGVALRGQQALQENMLASWVADNQMALLFLLRPEQRASPRQGDVEMAGRRWYWRTSVRIAEGGLLQHAEVEVSLVADFRDIRQSRQAWLIPPAQGGVR